MFCGGKSQLHITALGDWASNPTSANDSEPERRVQSCEARKPIGFRRVKLSLSSARRSYSFFFRKCAIERKFDFA